MKILKDPTECESWIAGGGESILGNSHYKAILNRHYAPNSYRFYLIENVVFPLVEKEGMVTFYGGPRHNYCCNSPENSDGMNQVMRDLFREGLKFRLLSMVRDPFPNLDSDCLRFDVPYTAEWHYEDIQNYHIDSFLGAFAGKTLWSWKRILRQRESYHFETLEPAGLELQFEEIMAAHIDYFASRGKASVWAGGVGLLREILNHFKDRENLRTRSIRKDGKLAAFYVLVHRPGELIYYFGGSLCASDHYISKVMYLDLLESAREIAHHCGATRLNGLAGAFGNKRAFGFRPSPLYALVHDPGWIVRRDPDLTDAEFSQVYGRNFGAENE